MQKVIVPDQIALDEESDLKFDALEFTDNGGYIVQHNISISVKTLTTCQLNAEQPQFTFTTEHPITQASQKDGEESIVKGAWLIIEDLQSDITVVNAGCQGGDGGRGGDGADGRPVPPGSHNGLGGCGADGGNGGRGGDGGDAPSLDIRYHSSNNSSIKVILAQSKGGSGGLGGQGGAGGLNADGTRAKDGNDGQPGVVGEPGKYGIVHINGVRIREEIYE